MMRHRRMVTWSFVLLQALISSCTLGGGISDIKPTPTPLVLQAPDVPPPVTTPEAFLPIPTPVPTAEPTATPYPQVIPAYGSRCGIPAPRYYPHAHFMVGYLTPTPTTYNLLASGDFSTWCYQVIEFMDNVRSDVSYDRSSRAALETFAAANRDLAEELAGQAEPITAMIYFRDPLEPEEYRQWVQRWGVQAEATMGDCPNCPTGGLGWNMPLPPDDPYPYDEHSDPYHQIVLGVLGKVAADEITQVVAAPEVFIADLTSNVIRREVESKGLLVDTYSLGLLPLLEDMPVLPMRELGIHRITERYPPDTQP